MCSKLGAMGDNCDIFIKVKLRARQSRLTMPAQANRPILAIYLILMILGASAVLAFLLDYREAFLTSRNLFFVFLILMLLSLALLFSIDAVRISRNITRVSLGEKLIFISDSHQAWFYLISSSFALLAGASGLAFVFANWSDNSTFPFLQVILPALLVAIGIFGVHSQIQLIRFPRSLALDPTGVSGRAQGRQTRSGRGTPFSLKWEELREVVVHPRWKGTPERVMLRMRNRETLTFLWEDLGGDIREIAKVVEFFRTSPPAQRQLADPVAALDLAATTSPPIQRVGR